MLNYWPNFVVSGKSSDLLVVTPDIDRAVCDLWRGYAIRVCFKYPVVLAGRGVDRMLFVRAGRPDVYCAVSNGW